MRQDPERPHDADPELVHALDRAARLERELLAETRQPPTEAEVRAVEATLARAWAPGRAGRLGLWLIAAGLLLGTFLLWRTLERDEPPRKGGIVLGAPLEIIEPIGPVKGFTLIRWRTGSSGSPWFRVRVRDVESGELLLEVSDLRVSELALENQDTSAWTRIRIEVDELDASEQLLDTARADAWR